MQVKQTQKAKILKRTKSKSDRKMAFLDKHKYIKCVNVLLLNSSVVKGVSSLFVSNHVSYFATLPSFSIENIIISFNKFGFQSESSHSQAKSQHKYIKCVNVF